MYEFTGKFFWTYKQAVEHSRNRRYFVHLANQRPYLSVVKGKPDDVDKPDECWAVTNRYDPRVIRNKIYLSKNNFYGEVEEINEILSLGLLIKPVIGIDGYDTCTGCFFLNQDKYNVCHRLDCDGTNHVFTKER